MSRTYRTQGIILKRLNLGEADKLLTIYTKHYGKMKILAKGVRKIKSRRGGNVELFNLVSFFAAKGKNLDLLTEVETISAFKEWRKDLGRVSIAYYFCELVDKLTPEGQANQAVFNLLRVFLEKIGSKVDLNLVRTFEENLLDHLGFGVPEGLKNKSGSLKTYIEEIIEKEINTPKIIRKMAKTG